MIRVSDRTVACVVIFLVVAFAFGIGCERRNDQGQKNQAKRDGKDPMVTTGESFNLEEAIKDPRKTDDEKWALITQDIKDGGVLAGVDWPVEKHIRYALKNPTPNVELWLLHFPNIVHRLNWEVGDLTEFGDMLDCNDPLFLWDEEERDEKGRIIRVYKSTNMIYCDAGRIILLRLTGIEFKDQKTFQEWFGTNQKHLKWNKTIGKFENNRGNKNE